MALVNHGTFFVLHDFMVVADHKEEMLMKKKLNADLRLTKMSVVNL